MFGSIYLKLYFWFLLVFVVTLFTVAVLANHFHGTTVRKEMEEHLVSHARFLAGEYESLCGGWFALDPGDFECERFLRRLGRMRGVGFWILDSAGKVQTSAKRIPPPVDSRDIRRAAGGETVVVTRRRFPSVVVLPLTNRRGEVRELFVLDRPLLRPYPVPRFPLFTSLGIAGLVIAVLVLPLSLRLTRPIRELHQLGQEWAEGRLDQRAQLKGTGEIADLAGVFNKMAGNLEKTMEQRKEFLALISHELKSPLTRMKIALELLAEKKDSDEDFREKLLLDLKTEVAESENLVEQLLVLSRVEMMPLSVDLQEISIGEVVEKAVKQAESVAENSQVFIDTLVPDISILGDPEQLQRAVGNVLENAIKFSNKNGRVSVKAVKGNGSVRVEICDQGVGIASIDYENIFEPFYRSKTAKSHQGSGLGLFIARRIVEMNNGTIHASPNTPSGTVVTIQFPSLVKDSSSGSRARRKLL